MPSALALLVLLSASPTLTANQADAAPSAQEVAASLQRKYDSVLDFSADFIQTYESGPLRRKIVERGSVLVKKPGKMRWNYKAPEEKLFVSDGAQMYFHVPAANQVTVTPVPAQEDAASAALFLTGKGNIVRDFDVTFGEGGTADTWVLRLKPKRPQPEYDWLEVVVDRKSMQIRSLAAADTQGGRQTFQFSNFKENVGLADKTFAFSIPRGADVIYSGRAKR